MNPNKRLQNLLSVDNQNAHSFYDGIVYEYPHIGLYQIFEAYVPIKKREDGLEPRKPTKKKVQRTAPTGTSNSDSAVQRAKSRVRMLALANRFDLFVTFTFNTDRQDVDKCMRKMHNWLKNQQKRHGKFKYLVVGEFHEDGVSLHFHALIAGYTGKLTEAINPKTGEHVVGKNGKPFYSLPGFRLGFTNAQRLGNTLQDRKKTPGYLTKYFTKNMLKLFNKKRYWTSHDLQRPDKTYGLPDWYRNQTRIPLWSKSLQFGRLSYFVDESIAQEHDA